MQRSQRESGQGQMELEVGEGGEGQGVKGERDGKGKKGGCTMCHAPSWLDPGELSHTCIHLTMDHDSTQLNTLPCMGNVEYSLTRTSPTSTDISVQAGMAC